MRRRRQRVRSGIALPVTPMLDLSFQLMFFLMLAAHDQEEGGLRMTSPGPAVSPPGVTGPDAPEKFVIRANANQFGALAGLTVQSVDGEWSVGDAAGLKRLLSQPRNIWAEPVRVRIKADARLSTYM